MYLKQQMKNGIRIVTEEIPYVNSVSVGIWVKVGSRNETSNINGVSHFIEHMLFKGTQKRNAKEIANSIDKIGGQLNAFTAKESTCYYAKVLDSHFDIALDVLADMFMNSNFAKEEIEKEKGVIMEEINMYEDSPEDLVHDLFSQGVWSGNPLGMSILGTEESLNALSRERIFEYYQSNYIPENIVISVVGNIKHEVVVEKVEKQFGQLTSPAKKLTVIEKPSFDPIRITRNKETEQVHLCIGFEGVETDNESFYPLLTMNNIFGGAMSSRLFQNIREDKGLAYSVFSYPSSYQDCGLYSIYAG
ncbi:MAG: peptidase domain protein, partial [Clostridia bacterium]|nr:peptidase domain protein [Clostridia bacterium]